MNEQHVLKARGLALWLPSLVQGARMPSAGLLAGALEWILVWTHWNVLSPHLSFFLSLHLHAS